MRWVPAILWAGVIFAFSHSSSPPGRDLLPDYVGHAFLWGVLALLLVLGKTSFLETRLGFSDLPKLWLLGSLYGVFDEWHQSFVPGRDSSFSDVVVDSLATALTLAACFVALRRRDRGGSTHFG